MIVVGLLTTEEEAHELQSIATICSLEERIHRIVIIHRLTTKRNN